MNVSLDEPLEPLGILVGLLLIAAGVGTLATAPWTYSGSTTVTVLRIAGTVATIAIGVGLLWLVRLDG